MELRGGGGDATKGGAGVFVRVAIRLPHEGRHGGVGVGVVAGLASERRGGGGASDTIASELEGTSGLGLGHGDVKKEAPTAHIRERNVGLGGSVFGEGGWGFELGGGAGGLSPGGGEGTTRDQIVPQHPHRRHVGAAQAVRGGVGDVAPTQRALE